MSKKKIKKTEEEQFEELRVALNNMMRKHTLAFLDKLTEAVLEDHPVEEEAMKHWRGVVCNTIVDILMDESDRIEEECEMCDIIIPGDGAEA